MNRRLRTTLLRTIGVSLVAGIAAVVNAQPVLPVHKPVAGPMVMATPARTEFNYGDANEKAIAVDKTVNLNLCVTQGNLTINGWSRGEVRVVIRDGSRFGFKTQYKNPASGLPALVSVAGFDKKNYSSECVWGDEIEIDAPVGATINIKGKEIHTVIDTIRKASVNIIGGDIILRNISEGVSASTGQGDITVEESTGPIKLETTTGNVVVFDAAPREIGDVFRASTNSGNLSLQQLGFRQVEVKSISGSLMFSGDIVDGAAYSMNTTNGSIRMQIPQTTNCQVSAVFVAGNFNTEIPYKLITENVASGEVKMINAKFGKGGESVVKLTTSAGSIAIKKLQ